MLLWEVKWWTGKEPEQSVQISVWMPASCPLEFCQSKNFLWQFECGAQNEAIIPKGFWLGQSQCSGGYLFWL